MSDKEQSKKAKEYLSQIGKIDHLIQRLDSTVATLRSSLTSQNYELNPNKVQTSGPKDTLSETVAKIVDFEADINTRIDELVDLKREAFKRIKKLPDHDQQNILIARYVEMKQWLQISDEINFSISQVYKIHGKALLSFAKENSDLQEISAEVIS